MSKFKVGDKVRLIKGEGVYPEGVTDVVTRVEPSVSGGSLLWFEGDLKKHIRIFDYRFELVNEGPSSMAMTSFKVGDKVRRKVNDRSYSAWSHGDKVLTVSRIEKYRDQQVLMFKEVADASDGFRFELVEEAKPAVVPQLPGIPDGFRAVRIGTPAKGEWYVQASGVAGQGDGYHTAKSYTILEKIEQPAPVEPVKPEAPAAPAKKVAPVFQVGDKVRLVDNSFGYEKFQVGSVAKVVEMLPNTVSAEGDLLTLDGVLKDANGMFAYRFELVTESPDDLVIQDRVPSRAGIDFGWWVSPEEFDKFDPKIAHTWRVGIGFRDGLMHGYKHEACPDRLAVMCYRKDLPEVPTTEKVLFTEYVCWDDGGPRCILWQDTDPTSPDIDYNMFDHAHPTGNTREVEVPIVKP